MAKVISVENPYRIAFAIGAIFDLGSTEAAPDAVCVILEIVHKLPAAYCRLPTLSQVPAQPN